MDLLEIRFHGRGGQGIVVGSGILGMAFSYEGKTVQFFPEFGVERRGAPLQAFLRVSDTRIRAHYSISEPDHVILFDSTLLKAADVARGLKRGGWLLVNSRRSPDEFTYCRQCRIASVDADGISLSNNLGTSASPVINAAIAGAFAKIFGDISLDSVARAITESVPAKIKENIAAARIAYESVLVG